jgi:hypothetical protein
MYGRKTDYLREVIRKEREEKEKKRLKEYLEN